MESYESFGRWIKQRRKALDQTQAELAREVGCAEITIRKIEADELRPSHQVVVRLANALRISPAEQIEFLALARGVTRRPFDRLPAPVGPLIGRDGELTALRDLVADPAVRLVTLTGPGGAGKTRLALQAATDLRTAFRDGVCFVPLAPINDPELVLPAIGQALGVASGSDPLAARMTATLEGQEVLLVLDNFEQVLGAAEHLAGLLARLPHLKLLITSQALLRLSDEREFAVPPLGLPDLNHLPPISELAQYPAIALFLARAQTVRPQFVLTPANAPTIAAICARLDGLPLALDLAAARIKLLQPPELLRRLEQRLHLLTGGSRDLPVRQQTLRDALDWSYNLLTPTEQGVFRGLGVFVGGCTLAATEAVCGDGTTNLLPVLEALVDHSLLQVNSDGRLTLLETMREYALDQLAANHELDQLRARHAQHYLALAEQARPHLQETAEAGWLDQLETEYGNLRTALDWSRESDPETLRRLAASLWEFWLIRGHFREGRPWLAAALVAGDESGDGDVRARLFEGTGRLAWAQNDWTAATNALSAAEQIYTEQGNRAGQAMTLIYQGQVAEAQGDYRAAAALFDQSLALFDALSDRRGQAQALTNRAQIAQAQGQHALAATLLSRSLALFEMLDDRQGQAVALTVQGQIRHAQGDYTEAAALFERSVALFHDLGYQHGLAWALTNQGQARQEHGDHALAEKLFAQALSLYQTLGDTHGQAWAVTNQGHVALLLGNFAVASRLLTRGYVLFTALNDRRGAAWAQVYQGRAALAQDQPEQAAKALTESLTTFAALDDQWYIAECLAGLAAALLHFGDAATGARLVASARALRGIQPGDPGGPWATLAAQFPADELVPLARAAAVSSALAATEHYAS